MKTIILAVAVAVLASCATPPPRPSAVGPDIAGELARATNRTPVEAHAPPEAAMLPPLRMEMPAAEGRPIDPRFDLAVNNAPAPQVFMALVSGTRYSMLIHPDVTGTITVNLKDVTIQEALDSLRELYGYEFRFEGTRIIVQAPGLRTRVFQVNYLPGLRRGSSDLRVQSGAVTDTSSGGGPVRHRTA